MLLWIVSIKYMQWKMGFTAVKQNAVSNNVFKNPHVNISQLWAEIISYVDLCGAAWHAVPGV